MRGFIQMVCVLAIAVGAGLLAFGSHLEPQANLLDPSPFARQLDTSENRESHLIASVTCGFGIGLMIFGTLGLVMPWVNKIGFAVTGELGDNSARTIAMVAIWFSVAMILTFGVFRVNWTGAAGMSVILILVALICAAATITTAIVCGWKPWIRTSHDLSETDRRQAP
jgi:hypothetical protein